MRDIQRCEPSEIAHILGDNTPTVSSSPSQHVTVRSGPKDDFDIQYGDSVMTAVAEAFGQRRRVHLIEEDALDQGFFFRSRSPRCATHNCSSRSAAFLLLAILASISSG